MAAPSASTSWVEATTFSGDSSASAWSGWAEATVSTGAGGPSPFTGWVEATVTTGGGLPSDWSAWVEASTPSDAVIGYRLTPGGLVALGAPLRLSGGVLVPMLGGTVGPVLPPTTILPSAWSTWSTADLASTVWKRPLIGLIGTNESAFQQMNAEMGPVLIRRTYNTTIPTNVNQSAMASDIPENRISLWSWKPNVATFPGSATARAQLRAFLATIPAGHETYIMGVHEPEDNIQAGDYTLAQWGALQNAIATEVKSMGREELKTAFCLMGPWTFDSRSPYFGWNWQGVVDFDLIDMVGVDPYGKSPNAPENTYSLERLMTVRNSGSGGGSAPSMMEVLRSWDKPISLMEYGKLYEGATVAPEQVVATWLRESYDWFESWNQSNPATPIHSAVYYNMTITDDDTPLTTPVEKAAMAEVIAKSKLPI